MSESSWYYLDANRESVGPVAAELVRAALRDGRISNETLVWRDGLPEWLPLSKVANELGVVAAAVFASAQATPAPADSSLYRPPSAVLIDDTPNLSGEVVYAGFLRRWAALFLDSIILTIPLMIVAVLISIPFGLFSGDSSAAGTGIQAIYYLFYIVAAPLYYAGMESSQYQATLGKQALGIKVTDDNGQRLSFGHALGRWFAASLSYLTLYFGFLMAAFTERKRALHDMIASTLVVDKWAYTENPERQKRGAGGCLIIFLVGFFLIAILGILAAIAIPQYEEYVQRAQQRQ